MANENATGNRLYVGLMSGTSFDGIDAALLVTDGETRIDPGPAVSLAYDEAFRERLRAVMGGRSAPPDLIAELTDRHADAVDALLNRSGRSPSQVAAVGFHGQTIFHAPADALTVQIGDPDRLAGRTGIDVVSEFRLADVAAGGEGAPIAPIYHRAVLASGPLPAAMVNIGGVANVTWTDGEHLMAFDCGPGNAPLDDFLRATVGVPFDKGGRIAGSGTVDRQAVEWFLLQPYFDRKPPKSLDRDELRLPDLAGRGTGDAAATLAALCVAGIAAAARWFPSEPKRWIICGGGRLNSAIMTGLAAALPAPVIAAEKIGIDGGNLEAHMIAYLAARSLRGLPITFPGTTGIAKPTTGGRTFPAPGPASAFSGRAASR